MLTNFYIAFGTVCFTLLGLWLIIVQTRHAEWRSVAVYRRRAFGVALHFSLSLGGGVWTVPAGVWALTLFVVPFAFAIAILKDVPDAEGDRRFAVRTYVLRLGGRRVLHIALAALALAYLGMAVLGPLLVDGAQPVVLAGGHLLALVLLWLAARGVDPADRGSFTAFYMDVWKLFFLEYALVPLAFVL